MLDVKRKRASRSGVRKRDNSNASPKASAESEINLKFIALKIKIKYICKYTSINQVQVSSKTRRFVDCSYSNILNRVHAFVTHLML